MFARARVCVGGGGGVDNGTNSILLFSNKHGCGRAYETYKGIDLWYDLPKPISRRTFAQEINRIKELVIPGRWPYTGRNAFLEWVEQPKPEVELQF